MCLDLVTHIQYMYLCMWMIIMRYSFKRYLEKVRNSVISYRIPALLTEGLYSGGDLW